MAAQKTIVVTGGAGFVGSHLCERLVKDGHRVISLDNYFAGSKDNHVAGAQYREGHTKDIEKYVPETPDIVYHLGEYSRVAKSLEEPELVFDLNLAGTLGVLEFWRKKKCKLIYAGSSTKSVAPRESDGVAGRYLAPYTLAKAVNSEYVANYGRWFSLPYAVTYFYNVYGPRERPYEEYGTVIETFRRRFAEGKPLQVRSPGEQMRAYTHVDDTIEGLILVGEKGEGEEFGIAANEQHSLLEVARMFSDNIVMLPPTKTTRASAGDVDTAKLQALGWKQRYDLKSYIEEVKKQGK